MNDAGRRLRVLALVFNDIRRDSRAFRMSEALAADHEVVVVSRAPSRESGPTRGRFSLAEVYVGDRDRWGRSKIVLYWLRAMLASARLDFDVVHCHDVYPLVPAAILARVRGVPLIYDAHELVDHMRARQSVLGRFWDWCHRLAVRRADHVITPNESRAAFLVENGYRPRHPPVVVRNIPDREAPLGGVVRSRGELGIRETDFVVIYQGWVAGGRYSVELVRAFELLPDDFRLLLIGDGPAMPVIRALLSGGLDRKVSAPGYVPKDRVLDYMALSDLGVVLYDGALLNNYYCAPNKLYDYLNAGLRIVGNDLPELRKVVRPEWGIGVVAEGTDPRSLADAIAAARKLRQDPEVLEQLRKENTWSAEAAHLQSFYWDVAPATPRRTWS